MRTFDEHPWGHPASAISAGVQLLLDLPGGPTPVRGDADRLGQACDNLLDNAVKFTPAGGRVTLSLRRRTGATGPVAVLTVRDTGIGIPAAEQDALFDRFYRASAARERGIDGVGLGLAVTRAIVTAHGGTVDVQSTEGVGTSFALTLPLAPSPGTPAAGAR